MSRGKNNVKPKFKKLMKKNVPKNNDWNWKKITKPSNNWKKIVECENKKPIAIICLLK